ncbi:hypothetical protein ACUNDV_12345, partial [Serratia sp. IR-2025]
HNRHPPLTTTTTGHDGSVRLELDKQGVGRRMREGIDDKAFPEQGAKVSIHSDGSFEGLGCVLANTNLNVLTAVFYWFTLKRDEPFLLPLSRPSLLYRPSAIRHRWRAGRPSGYFFMVNSITQTMRKAGCQPSRKPNHFTR